MKCRAALALAIAAFPATANAYEYDTCDGDPVRWRDNRVAFSVSNASFPSGSIEREALEEVRTAWNNSPSNQFFVFNYSDAWVGLYNGQNEVWLADDMDEDLAGMASSSRSQVITTFVCRDGVGNDRSNIVGMDVRFNANVDFHYEHEKAELKGYSNRYYGGQDDYGGMLESFQTTAIHEFGHAIGLQHVANTYSIMGAGVGYLHTNGATATAQLGEDTSSGAVALYGLDSSAAEDLSVTHWKSSGEVLGVPGQDTYGLCDRTEVYNADSAPTLFHGEHYYPITRGRSYQVEFTYENNGKITQSNVLAGFYISPNSTISTFDRRIGDARYTLERNTAYTATTRLTMPTDLTPARDYWIGVIIDDDNRVAERDESNNRTYLPIHVENTPIYTGPPAPAATLYTPAPTPPPRAPANPGVTPPPSPDRINP